MHGKCENCGQIVLSSDKVCWHCGWHLPAQPQDQAAPPSLAKADSPSQPAAVAAILVYTAVTFFIIMAMLLVMRSLGTKPLDLSDPRESLDPGWKAIINQDQTFTLHLPPGWRWLDKQDDGQNDVLEETVRQNRQIAALITPFEGTAFEMEVISVAVEPPQLGNVATRFVVIARGTRTGGIALEDAISQLQKRNNNVDVRQANVFINSAEESRATLFLEMMAAGQRFLCEERMLNGPAGTFVVAGCTLSDQYQFYSRDLRKVLASFQPLTR